MPLAQVSGKVAELDQAIRKEFIGVMKFPGNWGNLTNGEMSVLPPTPTPHQA